MSILQDFLIAIVRKLESNFGCGVAETRSCEPKLREARHLQAASKRYVQ